MKYSIVIPSLNEEKHIVSCIKEVKKQAPDAEVIVVDGKSTDRTVELAESLGAKVVFENKKMVSAARNTGLNKAKGDIICYIDADVVPEKYWFKKLTSPFKDNEVMAVAGIPIPNDGRLIERIGLYLVFGLISPVLFKFNIPLVTGQVMAIRRKDAIKAGGFNTNHLSGEDTYIFLLLRNKGKIVHCDAKVSVSLRRIRKWGLMKYLSFNIRNYRSLLRYKRPINEVYEPIRN
jgi:glycosyltransferase involved in cell wall biosynthesis